MMKHAPYLMCKSCTRISWSGTGAAAATTSGAHGARYNMYDPEQLQEAFKTGMIDHCSKVVGNAAKKAAEIILCERDKDD